MGRSQKVLTACIAMYQLYIKERNNKGNQNYLCCFVLVCVFTREKSWCVFVIHTLETGSEF
jgi:hypothetical protein